MRRWLKKHTDKFREKRHQRKAGLHDLLKARYQIFRSLLASNNRAVDYLTEITIHLRMEGDQGALVQLVRALIRETGEMVDRLQHLSQGKYRNLFGAQRTITENIEKKLRQIAQEAEVPFLLGLGHVHRGLAAQAGNKAATLADLKKKAFPVPDGFVITLGGCRHFLEQGGLSLQLVHLLAGAGAGRQKSVTPETARGLQQLIRAAPLPQSLAEAITAAARPFFEKGGALAVRSSSGSEDSRHHSFAGQFSSVLNVRDQDGLQEAFKKVVASNFNARSLAYRLNAGLDPLHFDMAVLCLAMVRSRAAGILLSRSPQEPQSGMMLISAVPGLGEAAVAGSAASDLYVVDRKGVIDWDHSTIAVKEKFLACREEGGVAWERLASDAGQQPVLDGETVRTLAGWGKTLEELEGTPQDIEWAVDSEGRPLILQARPLIIMGSRPDDAGMPGAVPILTGTMAAGGVATGKALLVRGRKDLARLPEEPAVLVMHQSFVDAVNLLGRAAAVLVDLGSPADHLACVAREQQTPMVCGLQNAGAVLQPGQWLTVDGGHGTVHAATAEEIKAAAERWQNGAPPPPPAATALPPFARELQELVTALHLTDAYGPTFSILECRSLHDVVRFAHEKAVLAMFDAGDELLEENFAAVHVIESPVPFFVSVIDMGGGLAPAGEKKRRLPPETVICRPFQALWRGITTPGLHWGPPPGGAPMGSVVSSWLTDHKSERPIGMPNYALVSRDYCNMNARMDFHFIMIDAVCGLEPRSNHIRFRFKGGGTSLERRRRRALCIGEIFEHYGFLTDVRDDLVNASLQGASPEAIEEKLVMVGRVLGFTRLLDAAMTDDRMVQEVARAFLEGDYGLSGQEALRKGQP